MSEVELKRDAFGSIWLRLGTDGQPTGVLREWRHVSPWVRPLAGWLARREARALRRLEGLGGIPRLKSTTRGVLEREWIDGTPMQNAPPRDPRYFREASRLLRALHRRNVAHNDLAKEPNWLVTPAGSPALVDFQLASTVRRRSRLFRALAHDDLRHLLKHKRSYFPGRLTAREQRILATRSWLSRLWMASGKRVYLVVTRRWLGWADREGAGDRGLRDQGPKR